MSHAAVLVEDVGKLYRIPNVRDGARGWRARLPGLGRGRHDLWALRDVSFEAAPGEVLGIVGRNGAGKSTLLKILSGVTHPTTGQAVLRGRVASLLEVGTGFHPDLTGRENVYLNAALLGMRRAEIRRQFDRIVSFAEVEEFIDTPLKRYSTGMQMRLAFSVAAHLDGEILMVDEALSVGDAAFQAKCVETIRAARGGGRTVLLVSHNVGLLRGLATRAILLAHGRIEADGPIQDIFTRYLAASADQAEIDLRAYEAREGTGDARIESVSLLGADGAPCTHTNVGGPMHVRFVVAFRRPFREPQFGIRLYSPEGEALVDMQARHDGLSVDASRGRYVVDACVDRLNLYPGRYLLSLWVYDRSLSRLLDYVKLCASVVVAPGDPTGRGVPLSPEFGQFFVPSHWHAERAEAPATCLAAAS